MISTIMLSLIIFTQIKTSFWKPQILCYTWKTLSNWANIDQGKHFFVGPNLFALSRVPIFYELDMIEYTGTLQFSTKIHNTQTQQHTNMRAKNSKVCNFFQLIEKKTSFSAQTWNKKKSSGLSAYMLISLNCFSTVLSEIIT